MTQIFAHRGYGNPENTLTSFQSAVDVGADGIELDTYLTSDGVWVIDHLNRHLPSTPEEKDRESKLPLLEEVSKLSGIEINIELKVPVEEKDHIALGEKLIRFIHDTFDLSRIHISTFYPKTLIGMRRLDKDARLCLLSLYSRRRTWEKWNRKVSLYSYNPFYRLFRSKNISHLHSIGVRVHPWTVNNPRIIRKLILNGVDAIITDIPDVAIAIRNEVNTDSH